MSRHFPGGIEFTKELAKALDLDPAINAITSIHIKADCMETPTATVSLFINEHQAEKIQKVLQAVKFKDMAPVKTHCCVHCGNDEMARAGVKIVRAVDCGCLESQAAIAEEQEEASRYFGQRGAPICDCGAPDGAEHHRSCQWVRFMGGKNHNVNHHSLSNPPAKSAALVSSEGSGSAAPPNYPVCTCKTQDLMTCGCTCGALKKG